MAYKYVSYAFTRNQETGFLREQHASTDALAMLRSWEDMGEGRAYEELLDTPNCLKARLHYLADAQDKAAADLNFLQREYCLERETI